MFPTILLLQNHRGWYQLKFFNQLISKNKWKLNALILIKLQSTEEHENCKIKLLVVITFANYSKSDDDDDDAIHRLTMQSKLTKCTVYLNTMNHQQPHCVLTTWTTLFQGISSFRNKNDFSTVLSQLIMSAIIFSPCNNCKNSKIFVY